MSLILALLFLQVSARRYWTGWGGWGTSCLSSAPTPCSHLKFLSLSAWHRLPQRWRPTAFECVHKGFSLACSLPRSHALRQTPKHAAMWHQISLFQPRGGGSYQYWMPWHFAPSPGVFVCVFSSPFGWYDVTFQIVSALTLLRWAEILMARWMSLHLLERANNR